MYKSNDTRWPLTVDNIKEDSVGKSRHNCHHFTAQSPFKFFYLNQIDWHFFKISASAENLV